MADKNVQLHNADGDNLFPLTSITNVSGFGTLYTAAFTANSASSIWANLTGTVTLPPGTYLLIATLPIVSSTTGAFAIADSNNTVINNRFNSAPSYSSVITIATFSVSTTIRMAWQASASVNFSYKERGGLQAFQLG